MSGESEPTKLILKCPLSPGDIVMLTAAVRDLHRSQPGRFVTDVRTTAGQLWENNPYITKLDEADPAVRIIDMHYPSINKSNRRPYHFIHGYPQYLEEQLDVPVPVTEFKGDIHLSPTEKRWISQVAETGFRGRFWVILAGGKYDFTAKWWNPAEYQTVVNHFLGRILFVQCGESNSSFRRSGFHFLRLCRPAASQPRYSVGGTPSSLRMRRWRADSSVTKTVGAWEPSLSV